MSLTTIKIFGLVPALMLLPACASGIKARTALHSRSCEVSSLESVFAEPLRFDGKVFCGTAIIVVSPYIGFFTRAAVEADEDIALIPRGDRRMILDLVPLGNGKRLYLRGRLRVDHRCVEGDYVCTPVARPIYLDDFSVSTVPQAP